MDCIEPHFLARFTVRTDEDGGPKSGGVFFPETGMRAVPTRIDDINIRATIGIYHLPNSKVSNGESFEAVCRVICEEYWAGFIRNGLIFQVWDTRDIIDAEVIKVYPQNWEVSISNNV